MYTFVALLAFVVVVTAAPTNDQRCATPKQWEADETMEIDAMNLTAVYHVSYDAINKRVRTLTMYDPEEREYIILYNKRRLYSIVRKTGKCTVSSYDKPFTPAEIPKSAIFAADGFVGLKNSGLPYKAYYGTFEMEGSKGNYVISVTTKNCILMYSKSVFKGITSRASIYNVELGIKDPSVFTPPKSCQQLGPLPSMFKSHPRY